MENVIFNNNYDTQPSGARWPGINKCFDGCSIIIRMHNFCFLSSFYAWYIPLNDIACVYEPGIIYDYIIGTNWFLLIYILINVRISKHAANFKGIAKQRFQHDVLQNAATIGRF